MKDLQDVVEVQRVPNRSNSVNDTKELLETTDASTVKGSSSLISLNTTRTVEALEAPTVKSLPIAKADSLTMQDIDDLLEVKDKDKSTATFAPAKASAIHTSHEISESRGWGISYTAPVRIDNISSTNIDGTTGIVLHESRSSPHEL